MNAVVTHIHPRQGQIASIQQLQQQARALSAEFSNDLCRDIDLLAERCLEASKLDALRPGLREIYRRLGEHLAAQTQTAEIITKRAL